mmetsp:Transcript_19005/g.58566  ORF Transcript_19005/g.58566 Transcript_19005/m.58566 type:complete len:218 (-) Transcript_19005:922-1575(-)
MARSFGVRGGAGGAGAGAGGAGEEHSGERRERRDTGVSFRGVRRRERRGGLRVSPRYVRSAGPGQVRERRAARGGVAVRPSERGSAGGRGHYRRRAVGRHRCPARAKERRGRSAPTRSSNEPRATARPAPGSRSGDRVFACPSKTARPARWPRRRIAGPWQGVRERCRKSGSFRCWSPRFSTTATTPSTAPPSSPSASTSKSFARSPKTASTSNASS